MAVGTTPEWKLSRASRMVFIGLMLGMLVASISQTIVAPAMPIMVAELGGMEHYSWLATAAMLVSAVVVPIVGKLSDMYGRRSFYIAGLSIFMFGSVLAGMATDFWWLVGARGVQGLGMGALMTLSQTIIGDIIPPRQRGKYQGLMGAVFGVTSIAGPLLGGTITDNWGWRWLFYAALPVGVVALAFISKYLHIPHVQRKAKIDVAGIMVLTGALVSILLALSWGGTTYPWSSGPVVGLLTTGAVLLGVLIPIELRAQEPVLPLRLFRNSIFTLSNIASLAIAMGMFGAIFYIPVFAQGVLGVSVTVSGAIMIPMSMAMIVTGIVIGFLITKTGKYKVFVVGGTVAMLAGFGLLVQMGFHSTELQLTLATVVLGVGLGACMQPFTIIVQNAVSQRDLGTATASVQFFRNIGGTVGTALLGTILSSRMVTAIPAYMPADADELFDVEDVGPDSVLDPDLLAELPDAVALAVRQGMAEALHGVFVAAVPLVLVAFLMASLVKSIPLRTTLHDSAPGTQPPAAAATPTGSPHAVDTAGRHGNQSPTPADGDGTAAARTRAPAD